MKRRQSGISLIELMVAIMASGIVLFALGNIVVVNQQAMKRSQERVALQSHATVVMSRMARAVRGANRIEVTGANTFRLRDLNGALTSTFQLTGTADGPRLQMDGVDMAEIDCTRFAVTTNVDTTSVTLDLELTTTDGVILGELNTVSIRNRTLEY
ncbi:prepilin-type N-terminal cleavage/methylation domain-containing protein [bacterium]|nr:prepilin-type N-terminal cleavage/methylation domain-containing protein [bacterium]